LREELGFVYLFTKAIFKPICSGIILAYLEFFRRGDFFCRRAAT